MSARIVLLTTLTLACTASLASAQALDFSSASYASATGARDAVAVDLNRDGCPDLATANTGRNAVAILENRADGTGFGPVREIAVGAGPFDIDTGDLNRDGIPDLIVTTPDGRAIEILLMDPGGRPASRTLVAPGSQAWGATLADVTRDGRLDLVYTDYARNRVVLLPGTDAGGFDTAASDWAVGARPQGVVAADFNHDGLVDIAVAATAANTLDVLYGDAGGGFTRRTVSAGRTLNVLSVVDMNADGWVDIAALSTSTNLLVIFRGSASGFVSAGTRAVGSSPRGIAAGDFNQDGRIDLAVGNSGSGTATILLGQAGSVLPTAWNALPSGTGARAVAAADFNSDGRLDLAVGPQSAAQVWLHDNVTMFVAPAMSFRRQTTGLYYGRQAVADFNENGKPDLFTDVALLLDGTTQVTYADPLPPAVVDVAAADFNGDGHQDAVLSRLEFEPPGRVTGSVFDLYTGDGRGAIALTRTVRIDDDNVWGIRTGDVDRDGRLDLVAYGYNHVYVVRSVGFTPSVQAAITTTQDIRGIQLGDVTRDGIPDVVVSTEGFAVYPGDGTGGFGPSLGTFGGFGGERFALGDLNRDGRLDIVSDDGWIMAVILGTDAGGFGPRIDYPSSIPWDTMAGTILGDFNNDGHLDVMSYGGTMLFGDGRGALGPPMEFDVIAIGGTAFDWNRDGLLDIVTPGAFILNDRRAVNRPPVADAGPDRAYEYRDHLWDDEWCERSTPSFDPDLHRLRYEWRDETGTVFSCLMPQHAPGTYTFTLTVRDGRGGESSDTMRVTIAPQPEIVVWAGYPWDIQGRWKIDLDNTAVANRVTYPNLGGPKVAAPAAAPTDYVDLRFAADPTQTYKLWVRLKADNDYWGNDSIWVQFDGAVASDGQTYAIGSTSGLPINLEECSGCGISGWGWEDDGWGAVNRNGVTLRFPEGGFKRIRIQVREDGVSVDQVVLSAVKYRTQRPGRAKNDTVKLESNQ